LFISTYDKEYLFILKQYYEILKNKNIILKTQKDLDLLNIYDEQLSQFSSQLLKKRYQAIQIISDHYSNHFRQIGQFNKDSRLVYKSFSNETDPEFILQLLKKNRKNDILYRYMTAGLHKDNYYFMLDHLEFSKCGSLGQTRLAALCIKMTQLEILRKMIDDEPVLLLDDVVLELDQLRKNQFLSHISDHNQMFITLTDDEIVRFNENKINRIYL
jgi:DNA replication and repair protein RecF